MLNKIRNIEPGTDYKRTGKFKTYGNSARLSDTSLISISDSKEFSPALEYLAKIDWKLTNIKFIDKDKITFTLKVKNYEISTELNLIDLQKIEKIKYDVICELDEEGTKKRYLAKIDCLLNYDKNIDDTVPVNLVPLDILFERFASLKMNLDIKQSDTTLIKNLVEDIKKELEEPFGYINKIFLTFIRKFLQLPSAGVFDTKNYFDEPVVIVSINSSI